LFWKKKKNPEEEKHKLFTCPAESRGAFRIAPHRERPVEFHLGGKRIAIDDISSGGISFKDPGIKPGTVFDSTFTLPTQLGEKYNVKVKIVRVADGKCFCGFQDINPEVEDQIHLYVLQRQKEDFDEKGHLLA
jgi:hypothetical protein